MNPRRLSGHPSVACLVLGLAVAILPPPQAAADDWPQFRGLDRTGVITWDGEISSDEPRLLWSHDLGSGFAGPVIAGGSVYVFHRMEDNCVVECLDLKTGEARWKTAWPTGYEDDFGFDIGPRASPVVTDDAVFLHGAEGLLTRLDRATGKTTWQLDTETLFGSEKGFFGRACQPLVTGDKVILHVGGTKPGTGVVAFSGKAGEVLWGTAPVEAGYSAPLTGQWNGKPAIITFTREGILVLDPADGRVVFEKPHRSTNNASVNAALPVPCGDNRWFFTSSYNTGGILLDSARSATDPNVIWNNDTSLSVHYATPVFKEGHLYGFHGRQESGQELRCVEASSGKVVWSSGPMPAGSVFCVNNTLLLLTESGELILYDASPDSREPLGRHQVARAETRAPAAFADGLLVLRDSKALRVWDVRRP
jgi:outer membrane protein assembly factor BamB